MKQLLSCIKKQVVIPIFPKPNPILWFVLLLTTASFSYAQSERVSDGLQVLYTFDEGSGSTVYDVSGSIPGLDLEISDPTNVSWGDGSLTLESATILKSAYTASNLNNEIEASGELTVEAWITPDNLSQTGPSEIITLSDSRYNRNVGIGQGISGRNGTFYNIRLRSTHTGNQGNSPSLSTPNGSASTELTHLMYTRSSSGVTKVFLDGEQVRQGNAGGNLSNWGANYRLALGNEIRPQSRPWLGSYELVAIYSRELSTLEITRNYNAGPDSDGVTVTLNTAPIAKNDEFETDEATVVTGNLLSDNGSGYDEDADANALTISEVTGSADNVGVEITLVSGALLTVESNGSIRYNPAGQFDALEDGEQEADTFSYTVDDGQGGNDSASVKMLVNGISGANVAPVASDDRFSIAESSVLIGNVLVANGQIADHDPDGVELRVVAVNGDATSPNTQIQLASGALLTVDDDGFVRYDPNGSFDSLVNGEQANEVFYYTIADSRSATATAEVSITVSGEDVPPASSRVTAGLAALYTFEEGGGGTVYNVSGSHTGLDLEISDPGKVSWGDGSLTLDSATILKSAYAATDLNNEIEASGELTVETWITPGNLTQTGPAEIFSLSDSRYNRNIGIGQGISGKNGTFYNIRLRSTHTGNQGNSPSLSTPNGSASAELTHLMYTRSSNGVTRIFLNGEQVKQGSAGGNLSNWGANYRLALGNEIRPMSRPWLGSYDLVAIYNRELSLVEITQNYNAGADSDGGTVAPNTAPIANNDLIETDEATVVTGNLLSDNGSGSDEDADANTLTISEVAGSAANVGVEVTLMSGALLTVESNGSILYNPAGQFDELKDGEQALDTFTYTVVDSQGGGDSAIVTLRIVGVDAMNSSPSAADDQLSTSAGIVLLANVFADNGHGVDSDPDLDSFTVTRVNGSADSVDNEISLSSGALITLNSNGDLEYDTNDQFQDLLQGQQQSDSFTYEISDGKDGLSDAAVTVLVEGTRTINTAPAANNDLFETDEATVVTGNLLSDNGFGVDEDIDVDTLMISEIAGSVDSQGVEITLASGALLIVQSNGLMSYNPAGQFDALANGEMVQDTFSYTVHDGQGGTDSAIVTIKILGVDALNSVPRALDDQFLISADSELIANVFFDNGFGSDYDTDSDSLVVTHINGSAEAVGTEVTLPSGSLLTVQLDGTMHYNPAGSFDELLVGGFAEDSFAYSIEDALGGSASATVSIDISGVFVDDSNIEPLASDDSFVTDKYTPVSGNLFVDNGNGIDVDGDSDPISIVAVNGNMLNDTIAVELPSGAMLTLTSFGNMTYDPDGAFFSLGQGQEFVDTFTYTLSDQTDVNDATVSVTISGVSDLIAGSDNIDCLVLNTPLSSRYSFDELSGNISFDSEGNQQALLINAQLQPGKYNRALLVDEATQADLGTYDPASSNGLTISAWVYPHDFDSAEARIVSKASGNSADAHVFMVGTFNGDRLRFRLKTDNSTTTLISDSGVLRLNEWNFVVFTYDKEHMRIFHNGEEVAEVAKTGDVHVDSAVPVAVGNQPVGLGDRSFNGLIDDLRFYNGAIDGVELNALHTVLSRDCVAPSALASVVSGTDVTLSWEQPVIPRAIAHRYEVSRNDVLVSTDISSLGFVDYGLFALTEYEYSVRLRGDDGYVSPFSSPITITTGAVSDNEPPDKVENLSYGSLEPDSVSLSWGGVTDNGMAGLLGYEIYRDKEFEAITSSTYYSASGLMPDTLYLFEVVAIDTLDNRSEAAAITITTSSDLIAPEMPMRLAVLSTDTDAIMLQWDPVVDSGGSGFVSYEIIRNGVIVGESDSNAFTDSTVEALQNYSYSVIAVDGATIPNRSDAAQVSAYSDIVAPTYDRYLPMGGVFYGNYQAGLRIGNAPIAIVSSRRFRAERSGEIEAIRHNNRTVTDTDIESRCEVGVDPESAWCQCQQAGLNRFTCGYTLSNSYTVGNGGSIVVEIRTDDGSENHEPSDTILGRTSGVFVPQDNWENKYPILALEGTVSLVAGEIYHLVYRNDNPPTGCGLRALGVDEALNCPSDQGAMSLNGVKHAYTAGSKSGKFDPLRGNIGAVLFRRTETSPWIVNQDNISWYELLYSDDVWVGDSYAAIETTSTGEQEVGGDKRVRQVFTVDHGDRTVDGIWINFGHVYEYMPDGSPLYIELKDASNNRLASSAMHASDECVERASSGYINKVGDDRHCRIWEFAIFGDSIELIDGRTYYLELYANSNAGYLMSTYVALDYSPYNSTSRNLWDDAHAEVSIDGGITWFEWNQNHVSRDLPLLFTSPNQPRFLP